MFNKVISSLKKIHRVHKNFEIILDVHNRSQVLLSAALSSEEKIIAPRRWDAKELIVSLTTYSKRIHDVHLVIESIAMQTFKPHRIILWLDEDEFTIDSIPLILKKQVERGLEVRFCPNYRSYKKLIPTLQLFPDADIVTIDDDILYPHDMLELLVKEHHCNPGCVIGHRVHRIKKDQKGRVIPYRYWEHEISDCDDSFLHMAIGVGGVFYPAGSLNSECNNIEEFTNLAPNADDIWFKGMSLLNNYKHKKVSDGRGFEQRFLMLANSQDIALSNDNHHGNQNDLQFKAVFERYKLYQKL